MMNQSYEQQLRVQEKQAEMRRDAENERLAEEARQARPGLLAKLRGAVSVVADLQAGAVVSAAMNAPEKDTTDVKLRKPVEIKG